MSMRRNLFKRNLSEDATLGEFLQEQSKFKERSVCSTPEKDIQIEKQKINAVPYPSQIKKKPSCWQEGSNS